MDGDVEDLAVLESLKEYLKIVCPAVLNIPPYDIETHLDTADSVHSLRQFVAGPDVMALFAVKPDPEVDPDTGNGASCFVLTMTNMVFMQHLSCFNLGFSQFDHFLLLLS